MASHRLRRFIDSRLQPQYLMLVAAAIVVVSLVLAVAILMTSNRGRSELGITPGADFSGFFVAAQILNRGDASHLYDVALHNQLYHDLLPDEDHNASIPYVHPPFVAGTLQPLVRLNYEEAVAVWQVISACLYSLGVISLLRSLPLSDPDSASTGKTPSRRRWNYELTLLLALSFEPYAFECWLGGQLSSIAFLGFALSFVALQSGREFLAGTSLGLCFYKPTVLLLFLPMLLIGRRWKLLLGMIVTGTILVGVSVLMVGWDVNEGYLQVLLRFRKQTEGGNLEIRTWKYVDINNCLRLLLGPDSPFQISLMIIVCIIPLLLLTFAWSSWKRLNQDQHLMLWAATLTWTPILNLYFGIYDSVIVVQSILITIAILVRSSKSGAPLNGSGFAYLVLMIYLAAWFSQSLARMTGISIYTLLLMGLGCFQYGLFVRLPTARLEPVRTVSLSKST